MCRALANTIHCLPKPETPQHSANAQGSTCGRSGLRQCPIRIGLRSRRGQRPHSTGYAWSAMGRAFTCPSLGSPRPHRASFAVERRRWPSSAAPTWRTVGCTRGIHSGTGSTTSCRRRRRRAYVQSSLCHAPCFSGSCRPMTSGRRLGHDCRGTTFARDLIKLYDRSGEIRSRRY